MPTFFYFRNALFICVFFACAFFVPVTHAQPLSVNEEFSGEQELILIVNVDQSIVSRGISTYEYKGNYFLPIDELAGLFKIYVNPQSSEEIITGYLLEPEFSFALDMTTNQASLGGEPLPTDGKIFYIPDDQFSDLVYVRQDVLERLWGFTSEIELSGLALKIKTQRPLPYQIIEQRRIDSEKLLARLGLGQEEAILPFINNPYRAYGPPVIDLNSTIGFDANDDAFSGQLSINGVQELLWATADYSAQFDQSNGEFNAPENIRFRLTRDNIYDGALPFDLERVQIGDISQSNRDLLGRRLSGVGVSLTNKPNAFVSSTDPIDIEEAGIPGYEVELYRNNELIDVGVVDTDGLYRFSNLELFFGQNNIQLIFYGPQGQTSEVNRTFVISRDILSKGKTQYSFTALNSEDEFFEIDEDVETQPRGLASNFELSHGIASNVTAFGAISRIPTNLSSDEERDLNFVTAGVDVSAFNALTRIEASKQLDGGTAAQIRTLTSINDYRTNIDLRVFDNFETTEAGIANPVNLEAEARVRKNVRSPIGRVNLSLLGRYTAFESGTNTTEFNFGQSLASGSNRFSNNITSDFSNTSDTTIDGNASYLRRFSNRLNWRNGVSYSVEPETDLNSIFSELRYRNPNAYSVVLRADNNFNAGEKTIGVSVNKDFETILAGVDTDWSSDDGFSAFLRGSVSFGPYGEDGAYIANSRGLGAVTPVSARIFHDKNYNGVFDEDDEPLPDAQISLGSRRQNSLADEDGVITVLRPLRGSVNAQVLESSLLDPYKQPSNPGYEILPRAGSIERLEFPVIDTGAIDGSLLHKETAQPLRDVKMILIDAKSNQIIEETQTAFDGYFSFEFLKPGEYTIKTSPIPGVGFFEKDISITPENLYQFGVSITHEDVKKDDLFSMLQKTESILTQLVNNSQ